MFTGLITDIGRVAAVEQRGDRRFHLTTTYDPAGIAVGASIACSGVCLTVVDKGSDWFAVDVSAETLRRTTLGGWAVGTAVNLERALRLGDEMGGHIVTGHVDGLATVVALTAEGDSLRVDLQAPDGFARYVAAKGSVALDGVSLTVNGVDGDRFWVNIIPHTQAMTTLHGGHDGHAGLASGQTINFEIDVLARYVARLQEWSR